MLLSRTFHIFWGEEKGERRGCHELTSNHHELNLSPPSFSLPLLHPSRPKRPCLPALRSLPHSPRTSLRFTSSKNLPTMTSSSSKLIDPSNPPFVPLDPSGRSNGILASHNILAGTILPGEPHVLHFSWGEIFPLMSQTAGPISILQSLSYDQLQAFIAIPPVPPSFDPSGMVGTDLIMSRMLRLTPVAQNKGEKIVLFGFSRTKPRHSCVPNARLLVLEEEEGMIFGEYTVLLLLLWEAGVARGNEISRRMKLTKPPPPPSPPLLSQPSEPSRTSLEAQKSSSPSSPTANTPYPTLVVKTSSVPSSNSSVAVQPVVARHKIKSSPTRTSARSTLVSTATESSIRRERCSRRVERGSSRRC